MIKKYPWHFIYLIFVIICLANIFQKLKWSTPTDNIFWENTPEGLKCISAPSDYLIKTGDILLTINKYIVKNTIDLNRIIKTRKYCRYEIERNGLLKNVGINIVNKYTPLTYYILVFSGILSILLTLNLLNANLKQPQDFHSPKIFFLLNLSFAGFLIFSPTGAFGLTDFIFFSLDRISFIFFPAFLLNYSILFPLRSRILRKFRPRFIRTLIYTIPIFILILYILFLLSNLFDSVPELLTLTINHFKTVAMYYFAIYLILSLIFFAISNLTIITVRKQKRFLFPLAASIMSIIIILVYNFFIPLNKLETSFLLNLNLCLLVFLPLSSVYYLSRRRFSDIENIIKKTISISSIFLFIFGIFFFLGISIEKNKLLGLFWSITAILTAGLLFKPIEGTVQKYFEKIFFRGTFNFKRKLRALIESLQSERDLSTLSKNFLDTINHGFNLQTSSLIIHSRKNIFYSLPKKNKILLTKNFRNALFDNDYLVFYSNLEFEKRYPKDYKTLHYLNYNQFLPLKTQHKLTGLIAFSPKKDNTFLSIEDWELMFNISSSLTLSVENAFLYTELENQLTELNLLKEFNENIIENLNLGIVVLSKLNMIRTWNIFMEQKFNIPREKAMNKKAYTILGTKFWKQIHGNTKGISSLNNIKIDISGEELIFDIYISPLKDNYGQVIGSIMVFEDVSEKILMQNQLITTEKMASLGLLSAGIAHEINTPLTGISSYCQFILDNPKDSENKNLIAKIQEQVIRANSIIRTLLDFSRQKGEQPVELNINEVIEESISLLVHQLKKKNIILKKQFNFKSKLYGYSTRFQQLFINLFINASDAINHSNGMITIQGSETNEHLCIKIIDNGKGIEKANLEKIFDPFFTTKEPGEGTGLGLSISYNIVKEHYGEIKAESKVNQGTSFIMNFPIKSPLRSMKI